MVPEYDAPGVPDEYVAALKAMPPDALAAYCDAVRRIDHLEHAARLAAARLEPFAEVHPYVAVIVDTLLADLDG